MSHSFVEESNADKAIKALTAALAPRARVKREGKVKSVEASELVPGDIIIIQFGNIVPADVKLLGHAGPDEAPMQVPPGLCCHWSSPTRVGARGCCTAAMHARAAPCSHPPGPVMVCASHNLARAAPAYLSPGISQPRNPKTVKP